MDTIIALEKDTGTKCEADVITWRGMMTKVGGEKNKQADIARRVWRGADCCEQIMTAPFDIMNGCADPAGKKTGIRFVDRFQVRDECHLLPGE